VVVSTVYDICHNVGKVEKHHIDGSMKEVIMHRKGATRAFPAGHPALKGPYAAVGHPVFVPGTMGTASYVLVGTERGLVDAFGSSCHGAGRRMSRAQAKREVRGSTLREALLAQGIIIKSQSDAGLAEEAPTAYKDVNLVVDVIKEAGIAKPVVRMRPIAVIKGD
jgi:tRNA-splicing ligase RtcB